MLGIWRGPLRGLVGTQCSDVGSAKLLIDAAAADGDKNSNTYSNENKWQVMEQGAQGHCFESQETSQGPLPWSAGVFTCVLQVADDKSTNVVVVYMIFRGPLSPHLGLDCLTFCYSMYNLVSVQIGFLHYELHYFPHYSRQFTGLTLGYIYLYWLLYKAMRR